MCCLTIFGSAGKINGWSRGKQFVLFSRESRCFPRWSNEVNLISDDNKMTMVAAQWEEVLASDEGRNTKWLELHIYDIQLQLKLTMRFLIGKYTNRLDGFLVSKETVVLRRWGSSKQKFGFIIFFSSERRANARNVFHGGNSTFINSFDKTKLLFRN